MGPILTRSDFMRAKGHAHVEAFCLMRYASKDGAIVEWLWNSRDGVTPFIIFGADGTELQHSEFQFDRYMPNYVPLAGERVFVDMTPERARARAEKRVERYWQESGEYSMQLAFESREQAIEVIAREILAYSGVPDVITGAEYHAARSAAK